MTRSTGDRHLHAAARRPRRIAMLAFDGAQSLDVTGPLEVFAMANSEYAQRTGSSVEPYERTLLAPQAGPICMSSGLRLIADAPYHAVHDGIDTLFVAGGEVRAAAADAALLKWIRTMLKRVRRLASVCSGAFILAEAGVLNGRRATTHWAGTELLVRRYPKIEVDPDAIFVRDGKVATSAGVTAGIDLALALVEEDLGHALALAVARRLVVFLKRPGGQSQFSAHLAAQSNPSRSLKDLPDWLVENLRQDLSVHHLAARAGMSPRNFARVFLRETGLTPAKFVEQARVDAARRHLEDMSLSLDEVSVACGFSSAEQLRRSFVRHLRIGPQDYRRRFHHTPGIRKVG